MANLLPSEQNGLETYRVIILGRGGQEILLLRDNGRFRLPSVSIPRWERVAENLNAAVREKWGQDVISIFTVDRVRANANSNEIQYQVCEHWKPIGEPPLALQGIASSDVCEHSFLDTADFRSIQDASRLCSGDARDVQLRPFARPGWFRDLYKWAEAVVERHGFRLNGSFRQLNASPEFSLIRFETDGPAFWFKAVGVPNQREFRITRTLSKLFPKHVPQIVVELAEWNGWLTREVEGKSLEQIQECEYWEATVAAFAELQVRSIGQISRILGSGAHDLKTESLLEMIQPFMETLEQLMGQQTKDPPPVLSREELSVLGNRIREALGALDDLDIPDTLGHLDLNPGNVMINSEEIVFLDWAEAYVGNPVFSFQYLLEHARRTFGNHSTIQARLVNSFRARWEPVISRDRIATALELSPLLAVFAYAYGGGMWRDPESLKNPSTAAYLRSLTRRMNREAKQLETRRALCVC